MSPVDIQFDLEKRGILHVYRDRGSFQHAAKVSLLLREGGLERYAVSTDEIQAIEPALHGGLPARRVQKGRAWLQAPT
jgi:D-amino-acid dehydrogenase